MAHPLRTSTLAAATILLSVSVARAATTEPVRFKQDRFAIGFWVDPPVTDDRYRELVEAHFTMVIGGFNAATPDKVKEQIKLLERYDLRGLVAMGGLPPEQLPDSPAVWGYLLRDEPGAKDFAALREAVDKIRAARPGKLTYINLFPCYATTQQLGTNTYEDHVARFADEVDVDVLSMDHYPFMEPSRDTRRAYCDNLEVMRKNALRKKIPFWNFFNTMPFGSHYDPTEAQLNWQIYMSIAYGAKGVLYFCYWTPRGDEFPKGGAIVTAEGRQTRHYEQAKRINAAIKSLGPTLMKLTSTGVYRVNPQADAAKVLTDTPIRKLTHGDYLVGVFSHDDGRRAVLLNNYHFAYTAWPTVEFDVPADKVVEVCQETGKEIPLLDDSPAMEGMQLSIDAGKGRLFLLPPGGP